MTRTSTPLPSLSDGRVLLRAAEPRDLPAIEAGIHDPDVIRWIGPQPASAQEALARDEEWRAKGSPTLLICEPDGTCVGKVWLEIRDDNTGFIGYWLLPAGRGRGMATGAVRLLSAWAQRDLGVRNLRITTAPENPGSQRVAERSGFRRLGTGEEESLDGPRAGQIVFALDAPGPSDPPA